ncbi:hypothetical protein KP509_12G010800 [Ceratopteris richardii]|uniref:Phytocyanin domain-containing protein n=1 Tax=Ceratopteris richardii TaxID=49495 RepID=A0A8T2TGQ9_CERRI|nr:hypothetical protein KP509_12G010800 [Ceratopteris richardii]
MHGLAARVAGGGTDALARMRTAARLIVFVMIMSRAECMASKHTVGRSAGWTIPAVGNVNYSAWAADFTLSVGDVLVFKYDATLHDVMQVSEEAYDACDASQPMALYNDGETDITLDHDGAWFFICGVPGHCSAGQKLEVDVDPMPPTIAPSPNMNLLPPLSAPTYASSPFNGPSPSPSHPPNEQYLSPSNDVDSSPLNGGNLDPSHVSPSNSGKLPFSSTPLSAASLEEFFKTSIHIIASIIFYILLVNVS